MSVTSNNILKKKKKVTFNIHNIIYNIEYKKNKQ